jgi:hypothetical protein
MHLWFLHKRLIAATDNQIDSDTCLRIQEELFEIFWNDTLCRIRKEGVREMSGKQDLSSQSVSQSESQQQDLSSQSESQKVSYCLSMVYVYFKTEYLSRSLFYLLHTSQ